MTGGAFLGLCKACGCNPNGASALLEARTQPVCVRARARACARLCGMCVARSCSPVACGACAPDTPSHSARLLESPFPDQLNPTRRTAQSPR
jgi:hypothetical protein